MQPSERRTLIALQPRTRRLLWLGLGAVGYVFGLLLMLRHGIMTDGGGGATDVFAYWTAGGRILAGQPIYGPGPFGFGAYLYPPPLAQFFAPLSLLPFPVAVWIWRVVEVACLRVAVGSWAAAGIAILVFPPVIAEIDAANVHLLIAASVAMAIRGRAWTLAPVAAIKFASAAGFPLGLATDRRGLLRGLGTAVAVCAVSVALLASAWFDYAQFLPGVHSDLSDRYVLLQWLPLAARLGIAGALSLIAIRWPRVVALAALLALPIVYVHSLSVLVAAVARPGVVRQRPGLVSRESFAR